MHSNQARRRTIVFSAAVLAGVALLRGLAPGVTLAAGPEPFVMPSSSGVPISANAAALFQRQAADMQAAQAMFAQAAAGSSTQAAYRQAQKDTQATIFQLVQDVTVNKAKTADRSFLPMGDYIRG